jgi:ATP-dependent DNA helicase RecG
MSRLKLDTPVRYVKGVGPKRAELLGRLGIESVRDLLWHLPRLHEDRRAVTPIGSLLLQDQATCRGKIRRVAMRPGRRGPAVEATLEDETGALKLVWFHRPYLKEQLSSGTALVVSGKVDFRPAPRMVNPLFEREEDSREPIHTRRIVPVYPGTEGLGSLILRRLVKTVLAEAHSQLIETLPNDLRRQHRLPGLREAMEEIHFPENPSSMERARRRLAYEECLCFQLALLLKRRRLAIHGAPSISIPKNLDERIRRRLPFQLTRSQETAVREISADLARTTPMHRLLQGDVGSGKTAVAAYAMLAAIARRHQAAFMAPTEILAEQHHQVLSRLLAGSKVRITCRTGKTPAEERLEQEKSLAEGAIDLVIGTHALLEEGLRFPRLGLAVIDEQHKFGVRQRARLRAKGPPPHLLVMTATPIPRTLALTLYGDLDGSTITELPPGRKPVDTQWISSSDGARMYELLRDTLSRKEQTYVVLPLVGESEDPSHQHLQAAVGFHEKLRREIPEARTGLLHGQLPSAQKSAVMDRFHHGALDILVTTPVIEVGIDVPNATLIAVLHAERFGLAQLHQLRGRVGRGRKPGRCLLLGEPVSEEGRKRLEALCRTQDGFRIAEVDLEIRGPGEFLGTAQHGWWTLRGVDPVKDLPILQGARRDAETLLQKDPALQQPVHRLLRHAVAERYPDSRDPKPNQKQRPIG